MPSRSASKFSTSRWRERRQGDRAHVVDREIVAPLQQGRDPPGDRQRLAPARARAELHVVADGLVGLGGRLQRQQQPADEADHLGRGRDLAGQALIACSCEPSATTSMRSMPTDAAWVTIAGSSSRLG